MKFNQKFISSITAFYATAISAAASDISNDVVVPIKPNAYQFNAKNMADKDHSVSNSGTVNSIITRNLSKVDKFNYQAELTGINTYLVILVDKAAPHFETLKDQSTGIAGKGSSGEKKLSEKALSSKINYVNYLKDSHLNVVKYAKELGIELKIRNQFANAVNGFSVELSQDDAASLSKLDSVARVSLLGRSQLQSYAGPKDIGADKVWSGETYRTTTKYKGEGIVVGVLDTGINTDHVAFDDSGEYFNNLDGVQFVGECLDSAQASRCNNKLIGIRTYSEINDKIFGGADGTSGFTTYNDPNGEFSLQKGEDYHGHGSHVAGIIAGNVVNDVKFHFREPKVLASTGIAIENSSFDVSGVAPHAQIISYQVCDPKRNEDSCLDEAIIKAVDDAIIDGVDVLNFSISKVSGALALPWVNPVEMAFLNAHQANIFVAASVGHGDNYKLDLDEDAGNGDHPSPWLMSVGAVFKSSTHTVSAHVGDISGGDPITVPLYRNADGLMEAISAYGAVTAYSGEPVTGNVVVAESKVDMTALSNEQQYALAHCLDLPANIFSANEIAVCLADEYGNALETGLTPVQTYTLMGEQVENAGAGAMIIVNDSVTPMNIPVAYSNGFAGTFMYSTSSGDPEDDSKRINLFYQWAKRSAELTQDIIATINPITVPELPSLSGMVYEKNTSIGPGKGVDSGYLLPSVVAPGVSVLAPYADERPFDVYGNASSWMTLSGASTATAYVTGAAALVKQAQPTWSVSEINSALIMTASQVLHSQTSKNGLPDAYTVGNGLINVSDAINAGFVMHEQVANFEKADQNHPEAIPFADLNLAAAIHALCFSSCEMKRTIKATQAGSWRIESKLNYASAQMTITPEEFTFENAGDEVELTIKFDVIEESMRWGIGYSDWSDLPEDFTDFNNNQDSMTEGNVRFIPDNRDIPEANWQVVVRTKLDVENDYQAITVDSNQGKKKLPNTSTTDFASTEFTTYQPSVIEGTKVHLSPVVESYDSVTCYTYYRAGSCKDANFDAARHLRNGTAHIEWLRLQEGAKRIVADAGPYSGKTQLFKTTIAMAIGRDFNNNGFIDFRDEVLCISDAQGTLQTLDETPGTNNFCSITNPIAGDYWVIYQNSVAHGIASVEYYFDQLAVDTTLFTTVIDDTEATNINVSASGDDVVVDWQLHMEPGERVYSAFKAAGNNKVVNLDIIRGRDAAVVKLASKPTAVQAGAMIDLVVEFNANESLANRNVDLTVNLPSGLTLVPGSMSDFSSQFADLNSTVSGNTLSIIGSLDDVANEPRGYNYSTNETDALCKTPEFPGNDGSGFAYLGLTPITGGALPIEDGQKPYLNGEQLTAGLTGYGRKRIEGEVSYESDHEWAARLHKERYGEYLFMATEDKDGQRYLDDREVPISVTELFANSDNPTPWISFYENGDFQRGDWLYVYNNGLMALNAQYSAAPLLPTNSTASMMPFDMPYLKNTTAMFISPLWRASGDTSAGFVTPFVPVATKTHDVSGISVGTIGSKVVVNYDNAYTGWRGGCRNYALEKNEQYGDSNGWARMCDANDGSRIHWNDITQENTQFRGQDNYDMQVFMETGPAKHRPGQYEIIMAYDDIIRKITDKDDVFGDDEIPYSNWQFTGSAGFRGARGYGNAYSGFYYGESHFVAGPNTNTKTAVYDKIKNDLVVCFDYFGPEAGKASVSFKAIVDPSVDIDEQLEIALHNDTTNFVVANTTTLTVKGSLSVEQLPNIFVYEDAGVKSVSTSLFSQTVNVTATSTDENVMVDVDTSGEFVVLHISTTQDYFTTASALIKLFAVEINDSRNSIMSSFEVDVRSINDAPNIRTDFSEITITTEENVILESLASDLETRDQNITYLWSGVQIDEQPDNYRKTTDASLNVHSLPVGEHAFTITVNDGELSVSKVFYVTAVEPDAIANPADKNENGAAVLWLFMLIGWGIYLRRRQ
ncbi:S8 family serine peptidase [Thalassotalea psychrophila]|uniref:S8 family serine peptidase n=1 Tax=Thalassotalea psychrophila TaxID=3065647 RepID=A0ABY9TYK9_9GAMM|nr:S8 family serine peptidase [Colwelliaceae bacterium SQ149]